VLVSLGLDQHIEDFAFGVDRPPEIDPASVVFQIDLVRDAKWYEGVVRPNSRAVFDRVSFRP